MFAVFGIRTAILRLLFAASPAAIGGFVIAIVIDALNGEIWRAFAHVS